MGQNFKILPCRSRLRKQKCKDLPSLAAGVVFESLGGGRLGLSVGRWALGVGTLNAPHSIAGRACCTRISDIFVSETGQQQARAAPVFTPSPSGGRLGWGPAAVVRVQALLWRRGLPYPGTSLKNGRLITVRCKQAKTVQPELACGLRPATTKLNPNGYHFPPVIPAKAGIQGRFLSPALERRAMDSRLRGNDDVFLPARFRGASRQRGRCNHLSRKRAREKPNQRRRMAAIAPPASSRASKASAVSPSMGTAAADDVAAGGRLLTCTMSWRLVAGVPTISNW